MSEPEDYRDPDQKPRWMKEIEHPQRYEALYLTEEALHNLKYILTHVTGYQDLTLSEAVMMLCDGWIHLDNYRIRRENEDEDRAAPVDSELHSEHDEESVPVDSGVVNGFDLSHAAVLEGGGVGGELLKYEESEVFEMPLWRAPEPVGFQLPYEDNDMGDDDRG